MRQTHNPRRSRGRSNRKHNVPHKHQSFESNGPDVRIRGNAHQVYEKYLALARDANAAGDRVSAEGYYQHAEHYFRILSDSTDPQSAQRQQQQQQQRGRENGRDRQPREETAADGNGAATQINGSQGPVAEIESAPVEAAEVPPAAEPKRASKAKSAGKGKSAPKEERDSEEKTAAQADGEQPASA